MHHRAKFCADRSRRYGYMTVFRFFKMAAVRHLGFVISLFGPPTKFLSVVSVTMHQNLVRIGAVVSIICMFLIF